jgi:hypothetical protein
VSPVLFDQFAEITPNQWYYLLTKYQVTHASGSTKASKYHHPYGFLMQKPNPRRIVNIVELAKVVHMQNKVTNS